MQQKRGAAGSGGRAAEDRRFWCINVGVLISLEVKVVLLSSGMVFGGSGRIGEDLSTWNEIAEPDAAMVTGAEPRGLRPSCDSAIPPGGRRGSPGDFLH